MISHYMKVASVLQSVPICDRVIPVRSKTAIIQRLAQDLQPPVQSEDIREGIQSFIERRQANFKGR